MQLVVVIAVSAAESAAMAMRTTTSHKLFFSVIFLIYNLTIDNLQFIFQFFYFEHRGSLTSRVWRCNQRYRE